MKLCCRAKRNSLGFIEAIRLHNLCAHMQICKRLASLVPTLHNMLTSWLTCLQAFTVASRSRLLISLYPPLRDCKRKLMKLLNVNDCGVKRGGSNSVHQGCDEVAPPLLMSSKDRHVKAALELQRHSPLPYILNTNNTSRCLPLRHYPTLQSQRTLQISQNSYRSSHRAVDHKQNSKPRIHHQTPPPYQIHQNLKTTHSLHLRGAFSPRTTIRLSSSLKRIS